MDEINSNSQVIKKMLKLIIISGGVLVLLIVLFIFSLNKIMISVLHNKSAVNVPQVEGLSFKKAEELIHSLDLTIIEESIEYDETVPAGTIIHQHPPAGMSVRAGRNIRVVVSRGGEDMVVPDIIGSPLEEAQSRLAQQGLQMGSVDELYSTEIPKSVVITQQPSSGTVVTRGALVDIEVSKGLPPVGAPLVPDFIGRSLNEAQVWASDAGCSFKSKEDPKALGMAGTVLRQNPLPGQPLLEDETLSIVVVSATQAQMSKTLSFQTPSGSQELVVKVVARDSHGEIEIYKGNHPPESSIGIPVKVTEPTRYRIYMNDVLSEEKLVEP
ncbi:MAG: PASTA domain-containing protein [Elusimicrobiota bacterium]